MTDKGWLPPSPVIAIEILLFLQREGRAVPSRDVYGPVATALKINEGQRQLKVSDGKRSRWEISCQGARSQLVKDGFLNNGAHGVWSLTTAGEKKASEVMESIRKRPSLDEEFS